jgi:uncharacterized protein with PIN domain
MKTSPIMIRSISLICPECHVVVANPRGGTTLDEDVSPRWEALSHQSWDCPSCHKPFKLPRNPFVSRVRK